MADYNISQEIARQIAVGLYRQVSGFVTAAKRENLDDYERFKADYLATQATQFPAPVRHHYIRNQHVKSR